MYEIPKMNAGGLYINQSTEGKTIEQKIELIVNNKERIKGDAPIIYTERKEGIKASTNIRTDRFEIAVEASDKIAKSYKARREEKSKPKLEIIKGGKEEGEAQSTQGTEAI